MNFKQDLVRQKIKYLIISVLIGIATGSISALFIKTLNLVTEFRVEHPKILWALPLAGFFSVWLYRKYGKESESGNSLIIDEIHAPQKKIPLRMVPFVFGASTLSHLFGGSIGREGAIVQMGGSLAENLSRYFKIGSIERKFFLIAGMSAGFSGALGAPLAGALFGLEVLSVGHIHFFALAESLAASFASYYTVKMWTVEHTRYFISEVPAFNMYLLVAVIISAVGFGLVARFFTKLTHWFEFQFKKIISYAPLRPFCMGIILVLLFEWEGSYRFCGLGIDMIQQSFTKAMSFFDPAAKLFLTALTVSSGFKGGEFIPLVFMGSTLGSALSVFLLPTNPGFLAALGFAATFGAAANVPLTCTVLACEIFGWTIAPYALIACVIAYFCSSHFGIYKSQRVTKNKFRSWF